REAPNSEILRTLLADAVSQQDIANLRVEPLPERNWVLEAEALRGPVRAGRFLVHGSHDRGRLARNAGRLEIDAGLAFGTAHHATTRGCLVALDRLLKRSRPRAVFDIGTGTGILAIAAAKAAGAHAIAGDIDPIAVATARANVQRNGVARQVQVI